MKATFFTRHGETLRKERRGELYLPGDIVAWDPGGGKTHIGIVSTKISAISKRPLVVHNIGGGPKLEDMLFNYKIIGHYRYGKNSTKPLS